MRSKPSSTGAKQVARTILDSNKRKLGEVAKRLLEVETIDGIELNKMLTGSGDGVNTSNTQGGVFRDSTSFACWAP